MKNNSDKKNFIDNFSFKEKRKFIKKSYKDLKSMALKNRAVIWLL